MPGFEVASSWSKARKLTTSAPGSNLTSNKYEEVIAVVIRSKRQIRDRTMHEGVKNMKIHNECTMNR